ncbi:DUF302 domain-containing protein [Mycoplasmopsis agassizii]|uniref:DUF302 domain-containing protein n=1 Tax=Mycoplasmopsis agassizii TaxID=33922 RepID=A0ABX4H617_9BACT|nr:DUF302 domain-containing protein [Mycoplasmopsis agassizii]PAF55335.1 DUF302 domain-containing protein [Mycoplasmopsis agassizii]SMC15786.1 Uncharacterized conserved protein, DUF302 family [Mycoplasmopsis agassizii]
MKKKIIISTLFGGAVLASTAALIACAPSKDTKEEDKKTVKTLIDSLVTSVNVTNAESLKVVPSSLASVDQAMVTKWLGGSLNALATNGTISLNKATLNFSIVKDSANDTAKTIKLSVKAVLNSQTSDAKEITFTFGEKMQSISSYESVPREIKSNYTAETAYTKIKELIVSTAADGMSATVFGEVDHKKNSDDGKLSGDQALTTFNKVIVFGNGKQGTVLMTSSPGMGLELPLRVQVYTKGDKTYVQTNALKEVLMLHGQMNATAAQNFENAVKTKLLDVVANAAPSRTLSTTMVKPEDMNGYSKTFSVTGTASLETATTLANTIVDNLNKKITAAGNTVFFTVDHVANDPDKRLKGVNKVLVFGNGAKGTTLMLPTVELGLDLPLKVHVYVTSDFKVVVATNATVMNLTKYATGQSADVTTARKTKATNFTNTVKKLVDDADKAPAPATAP